MNVPVPLLGRNLRTASLIVLVTAGCITAPEPAVRPENTDLSREWPDAQPEEQGFNPVLLQLAYARARAQPLMESLLVLRNGYLVGEEYFGGSGSRPDSLTRIHSVTKSFMSALVGIAIAKGYIESVDQTMEEFLVPGVVDSLRASERNITIRHLLTMTGGFDWDEASEVAHTRLNELGYDVVWRYALDKPVVDEPGTRFNYNTAAASLLSLIVTQATGMSSLDFASANLLRPLGIDTIGWGKDGEYYYGGSRMTMRPRDMAKLGALYVNGGRSGTTTLVPAQWVEQSTTPIVADGIGFAFDPLPRLDYGFLWWIDSGRPYHAFMAWGAGGQFIYCVPDWKLVVVVTTSASTSNTIASEALGIIVNDVVPSLVDR